MTPIHWLLLIIFLIFGPAAAALLLIQQLAARRYITLPELVQDVPDPNGEHL